MKQITQVLAESAQMRKEADDTGPLAELEHWRFLEARFNSFLEQLKLPKEQIIEPLKNSTTTKGTILSSISLRIYGCWTQ